MEHFDWDNYFKVLSKIEETLSECHIYYYHYRLK